MEHVIFVWSGKFSNYIQVCLTSLRIYNKECIIYFYYNDINLPKNLDKDLNINFCKIQNNLFKSPQYYQIIKLDELSKHLNKNDKILALDCDLLFQNNPFLIFEEKGDFYYSHSILSKPDSLRPEKLWKSVTYRVNSGVFGLIINDNSIKFMNFWRNNLDNPSWEKWINYKPWIVDHKDNKWWWVDQDFINCIDNYELPFPLKKIIFSYKYNYFVSTWGHFHKDLNMGNKIGNSEYGVIHFKGQFKDTYNLDNPQIYNLENILAKKDLTTEKSRKNIYLKFMSRGDKRFSII